MGNDIQKPRMLDLVQEHCGNPCFAIKPLACQFLEINGIAYISYKSALFFKLAGIKLKN